MDITMICQWHGGQYQNQIDFILAAKYGEVLYSQQKQDRE